MAVLERRHVVGGAAVTEELLPGYKFSRASYLCSLFRPQIFKDLKLKEARPPPPPHSHHPRYHRLLPHILGILKKPRPDILRPLTCACAVWCVWCRACACVCVCVCGAVCIGVSVCAVVRVLCELCRSME